MTKAGPLNDASNLIEKVDDQPQHLPGIAGPITDLPLAVFQNFANTSAAGPSGERRLSSYVRVLSASGVVLTKVQRMPVGARS